jgi:hypothetical protein
MIAWKDSKVHLTFLFNRVPLSIYIPRQRQSPNRKEINLTKLQPFGITCLRHIKNARRLGKHIFNHRGEQGILVRHDDDQGSLLA